MLIFSGRDVKRCVLRFSAGGIVVIAVYRPAFAQFHSSCVERESYTRSHCFAYCVHGS